jgi:hypothetical protein
MPTGPTFRSLTTGTYAGGQTDATVSKPSGLLGGDALRVEIFIRSDATLTVPSGWNQEALLECDVVGKEFRQYMFTKRASGVFGEVSTEPSTWAWTWTGGASRQWHCYAYQNCRKVGSQWSFAAGFLKSTTTDQLYPDCNGTTLDANELLSVVCCSWANVIGGRTTYSGFTEREDTNGQILYGAGDKAQAVAGATGTVTGASYVGAPENDITGVILAGLRPSEFPIPVGTPALTQVETGNPQAVTMPSGIVVGELLTVFAAQDVDTAMAQSGGSDWTKIDGVANSTVAQLAIFVKVAAGGDTLSLSGASTDKAIVAQRWDNHGVVTPATDVVKGTAATGTSATPDPPNCNPGTAKNFTWVEAFGADDDDNTSPYVSTNYAALAQAESAQTANSCMCAVGYRMLNASAEDPGTMAMAASEEWVAQTIAIPPAGAVVAITPDYYQSTYPSTTRETEIRVPIF